MPSQTSRKRLPGNRIPEPRAHIVKTPPAEIPRSYVKTAQPADGKHQRPRHPPPAEPHSWTGFDEVGPIETLGVPDKIVVPEELRVERAQARRRHPDPRLPIEQEIVLEPAHVEHVGVGLEKPSRRFSPHGATEAFSKTDAAAIIGSHPPDVRPAMEITDRRSGFAPSR